LERRHFTSEHLAALLKGLMLQLFVGVVLHKGLNLGLTTATDLFMSSTTTSWLQWRLSGEWQLQTRGSAWKKKDKLKPSYCFN